MQVRDWMTQNPITVEPHTPAAEAFRIFREYEIRHLPVVQDRVLVGIVTDHDVGALILDKLASGKTGELGSVERIMTRKVITTRPDDTISKAALLMHNEKIGGLPVVEDGKLVGILTTHDLLEILVARLSPEE
jgi:acetoin utilization protein AcuB